jgi:TldD protein
MYEALEKCLNQADFSSTDLVQLRSQKRLMTTCTARNGVVEEFSNILLSGMSARAFVDAKAWGFSSTNRLDQESARSTLQAAVRSARAASRLKVKRIALAPLEALDTEVSTAVGKAPHGVPTEEIARIALDVCKGAREVGSRVADVKATYIGIEDHKHFLSSEGMRIRQTITRILLLVDVIAKSGGLICPATENYGHAGGLELFDKNPPYSLGKAVAQKAVKLLALKAPPSGQFHVVVHPTLCATLLHEAVGHPLEADLAMSGGGFGNERGKLVSSRLVTIYDDGHVDSGLGQLAYDDEGVKSGPTVLIEEGVLKSFMHDRTSAALADAPPTGNAHAWDYSVEPLIRQTNIGIEAGTYSFDEMIEGVNEGLLLDGTFGGQANSNADFTFGFQSATWLKHGRRDQELRGANVAGNAIEVFKTIDAVGREVVLRPGACGKYQFAIQGRVVPAIRCRVMVGGTGGS